MNLTNVIGIDANRNLSLAAQRKVVASARLSTGIRINSASDDAAGLAISKKMKSQIRGLNQADRNIADGMSLINTMEGGMEGITEILQRQRELTIQAMSDTNTFEDKLLVQNEIDELTKEISSVAEKTHFNSINLLNKKIIASEPKPVEPIDPSEPIVEIPDKEIQNYFSISNPYTSSGVTLLPTIDGFNHKESLFLDDPITLNINGTDYSINDDFSFQTPIFIIGGEYRGQFNSTNGLNLSFMKGITYNKDANGKSTSVSIRYQFKNSSTTNYNFSLDFGYNVGSRIVDDENGDGSSINVYDDDLAANISDVRSNDGSIPTYNTTSDGYSFSYDNFVIKPLQIFTFYQTITLYDPRTIPEEPEEIPEEVPEEVPEEDTPIFVQCGANPNQKMQLTTYDCTIESLGLQNLNVLSYSNASKTLGDIDNAIDIMSANRSKSGAEFNRLEYSKNSAQISSENLESSKSRILDSNMAKEMMEFVKSGILENASIAMLTQSTQQTATNIQQILQ